MSAILSADDLNDFISPGVACIKPVETLPKQDDSNPYEVTTEDKAHTSNPAPASISLTDCLACSGCVTSAEAVLISLQSHTEVLNTLDTYPSLDVRHLQSVRDGLSNSNPAVLPSGKLFVASVSPQVRASLAATFNISERCAGWMIEQFLSGPDGLVSGGQQHSGFSYVVDTNRLREVCLVLGADEVEASLKDESKTKPILTSACPGWICYAEKTHPHILPHLSSLKSPQAMTGTLLKSVLSKSLGISPSQIWHLAIMPCFDKKLEASREELTNLHWQSSSSAREDVVVRDVDCVITSRELLSLASSRNINLASLPRKPLSESSQTRFPDQRISQFLFPKPRRRRLQSPLAGTSGGYIHHILQAQQSLHPGSTISTQRGRNADVVEYSLLSSSQTPLLKCARYYGFRNIQNLVRKLKPPKISKLPGAAIRRVGTGTGAPYAYVEVMACPGGCTNGGGQIRVEDVVGIVGHGQREEPDALNAQSQKEWLRLVDEAYYSAESDEDEENTMDIDDDCHGRPHRIQNRQAADKSTVEIRDVLKYWSNLVGVSLGNLGYTTYRKVESDVGKKKPIGDSERIAAIAGMSGGGW